MANLLTGDYEAVLQVSEATLNRLLASMHQNAWRDPTTPSFPHSVGLRLGDDGPVDGVQGTAWAQVAVPRFHLIDESTNAFDLEVSLRIRYVPDPDTTALPTYMQGKLRARYRMAEIDPSCLGWGRLASESLWFRVVDGSVSFTGTFGEDELLSLGLIDEDQANAAVTKQLAHLLANNFDPAPQRLSGRFRQRLYKSIVEQDGLVSEASTLPWVPDVPIGGSAVLVPIGVTADPSPAALGSLEQVLLNGRDFSVAVRQELVMGAIEPAVSQLRSYTSATEVKWSVTVGIEPFAYTYEDSTVYHASIDSASASWEPNDTYARIVITASGHAHTNSILPDFSFTVTQPLHLEFNGATESLAIWAEGTTVNVVGQVALPGGVWGTVANTIANTVQQNVSTALADPGVQSALGQFSGGAAELAGVLRTMDGQADAHFDEASFYVSGVVLRGSVSVARRRKPKITFEKLDANGFSALQSWIPGGRIDRLRWTWAWNASWSAHDSGEETLSDRYVLRRPPGDRTPFGMTVRGAPLPGLDGNGRVCLSLVGVVVNPVTGQFEHVETEASCERWGFVGPIRRGNGSLYVPEYEEAAPQGGPHPPGPVEIGVMDITALGSHGEAYANTLVVMVGDSLNEEHARTVIDGLAACKREDAGLLVALVYPDGSLDRGDAVSVRNLRAFAERLPAPLIVNEDLGGSWSTALSIDTDNAELAWRLVSPGGDILWMQDGNVAAEELSAVLDECLYPSPPATPSVIRVERDISPTVLAGLLDAGHHHLDVEGPPCPRWTTVRPSDIAFVASAVSFVRKDAASSTYELQRLQKESIDRNGNDPTVVLVVHGASESDADRLRGELGSAFTVIPDPDGSLAAGAGVRFWPTTVSLANPQGVWT